MAKPNHSAWKMPWRWDNFKRQRTVHPLPEGEGRSKGEGGARRVGGVPHAASGMDGAGWKWIGNIAIGSATEHVGIRFADAKLACAPDGLFATLARRNRLWLAPAVLSKT